MNSQAEDLLTHIRRVQDNAMILAKHWYEQGRTDFARQLLAKAMKHDVSKWAGIEWDYLHRGNDVNPEMLRRAINNHQQTNDHHPEFWGGLENMPEVCVAEMVCDWLARAQEFGTSLKDWIKKTGARNYRFHAAPQQSTWITECVEVLLHQKFAELPK